MEFVYFLLVIDVLAIIFVPIFVGGKIWQLLGSHRVGTLLKILICGSVVVFTVITTGFAIVVAWDNLLFLLTALIIGLGTFFVELRAYAWLRQRQLSAVVAALICAIGWLFTSTSIAIAISPLFQISLFSERVFSFR